MKREDLYTTQWALGILAGLQRKKSMYEGTVPPAEKQRRREVNKRARAGRKQNRG